jgi:tRNA(fMet)-specific endonuclease VapC
VIYFLDTNAVIHYLKGNGSISSRLAQVLPERIKISAIVEAELLTGAAKSNKPGKSREAVEEVLLPYEIVPFGHEHAAAYAEIRKVLEAKGTMIGPNDLILASTVKAADATVVTNNVGEFRRVPGLRVENWVA